MIFYVPSLGRSFWISPEVEQRFKARAAAFVREWEKRRGWLERLRRMGASQRIINIVERLPICTKNSHHRSTRFPTWKRYRRRR